MREKRVLERGEGGREGGREGVFHATMNPLTAIMHGYIRGDEVWKVATICSSQVCGIILAAAYVKLCTPSEKTIRKLTQKR
jgi:hypothetical protein